MADLDPANLHKLRVVDLKEILVKKGLSTSGLKAELVKRLRDALLNESPETQTEGQSPDADENLDKAYDNPSQSGDLADEEMMQKRSWRQEGHEEPMDIDDDQQADSNQQELEDAAGRRMAEEHQRRMAEERQKRLAEAEEQKRIEEERQREEQQKFEEEKQKKQKMLEENQNEEQIRMEEERRGAEQMKIEEEKQREEQMRVQEEERRREEQMRKEEERRREEQMRIEEERRREEQMRIEEERQREEQKRVEEERQKEKQRRIEEERRREEQRRVEEERRREEQRRMDEERRREEQRRMDEERRREEQRRMEEERRREEQRRMEEERRREEQRRMEELRQKEEQRRMEEQRRKEELRRIEEERRKEEQRLYAEEEKRKEERRLYLEEERRKEEQRLHTEEERRKEEQKKIQEAEIAKQQLAHQQKLLAEKEKIRLAEEQQRLLAEEQKRLMAEEQQRLLTEQQRLMAEEQQRLLVEEQQRILAEQQKLLAEQQQKRLAEQQQKLLIEQQQKFLGEQQQKMLAHQLTPPGLLPTSMPPPPPLQQFTQPPPAPPTSIVTTAIANAFPPPPPPALNNQTPSKEPDAAEKLSDKNEIQISDKDSISEQSEEIKLPHAVEKILALKNERAQQLGIDPDSVIETAVELKESTTKKTVSRGLVSIDENEDEELEEEETNTKVKESRRRRKKKKKQKRSTRVQRPNEDTTKTETVKEKDLDVDIEYVQDVLDPSDPLYSQFIKIFEKFKLSDSDKDKANADASMEEVKQEPKLVDKKKPMDLDDDDDDDDDDERDEKKEEDKPKLSKRKLKKLSRMTVAELKQKVSRPELVEMHDVTAKDPVLLLHLKASRNTVPVPRHWCFKRKYLQGKRGIEKPAFELPDFIKRTGIMEMRQALQEKEDQKTMKAKMRERVRPKLGKIDIDYQKLHDAFFKWQTKPKMTIHGDLYYEGKEFETRLKEKKPGDLNDDLRIALGMPTGPNANKCPPPWLIAMQRYGPPPSYPNLKIPGLNAPIPDACSFGYHAGGWGKPPVDEQGRPLYGDVFGTLNADDQPHIAEEEIDHTKWGELESESSEEEEEDEDEDEEEEEQKGEDETGLVTPAEGLITPSGFSSIPAGMETPDMIELRKRKIEAEMEGGETPALYTILPEKKSEKVGASMMGSTHIYDLAAAIPAAKIKAPGTTSVPPQGIEVALDPSELEMDTAAMAARYEQTMREQQSQLEKEDLSDMVAEHAARQKTKRKKLQQDSGKAPKKYKEFKF